MVTFMASKIPQAQQVMTTAVNAISIPLVWIKDNGKNQNIEMKKSLLGQIRVDASQKVN